MPEEPAPETRCIHGGQDRNDAGLAPPIFPASVYAFSSLQESIDTFEGRRHAPLYARYGHPTGEDVEARIASLEGAEACMLTASGMSVVSMLVAGFCKPGDHVIASKEQYGGTTELLRTTAESSGILVEFLPLGRFSEVGGLVRANTRLIILESPSNPLMKVADLAALGEIARGAGAHLVVDGTFASPALQRPLELGAAAVVHSTTKYLGGHSDVQGGSIAFREKGELYERALHVRYILGAVASPFNSWLVLRGIRTLACRMETQSANAMAVARALAANKNVEVVHYPGLESHPGHAVAKKQMKAFGAMLSFQVRGGRDAAVRVASRVRLFVVATSLGGTESLIEHRASSEGPTSTTPQNLLRVSVGLEHADDLIEDLTEALEAVG